MKGVIYLVLCELITAVNLEGNYNVMYLNNDSFNLNDKIKA